MDRHARGVSWKRLKSVMQPTEHTDLQLVEEVQSGNADAFDELMRRYKRPILNFVYRMLGDAMEADDVAQDVFVRAYQRIGTFQTRKAGSQFSKWLFRLARNAVIDRARWRKRHRTEPLEPIEQSTASTEAGVAEQVGAREIGTHVAAAVAALPEDQKTALILVEYNGMSYDETAQFMRCSRKSVEARLYRARQTLRQRLRFLLE
jgi:RNA polymerase sigma-70 factor, ECF subfamily